MRQRHLASLVFPLLIFSLPLAMLSTNATAANFLVSNADDSGVGSLRQAITEANAADSPPHTIRFAPEYPAQASIELLSPLPDLQVRMQIDGMDRSPVITPLDQIGGLQLLRTSRSLTLRRLSLQYGRTVGAGGCVAGVGINDSHTLVLDRMTFTGCLSAAIASGSVASGGAVAWPAAGLVTITDSVFEGNAAASVPAELALGGAIATAGPLRVSASYFGRNIANGGRVFGGAIQVRVTTPQLIEIVDSVFVDNLANPEAVPLPEGVGGAIALDCPTCTISLARNYFSGNESQNGGAVVLRGNDGDSTAAVTLHNSAFVDNLASSLGGAVYAIGAELTIRHATFLGNGAPSGGHVATFASTVPEWSNSVIAPVAANSGAACAIGAVASIAAGNFVRSDSNGCAATLPGSIAVPDLMVAGIDTSSFMPAVAFQSASPVVDGGDDGRCLTDDARGQPRPQDGDADGIARCDAGALERLGPLQDQIFADGFEG